MCPIRSIHYTYAGYPLILELFSKLGPGWTPPPEPTEWPRISIPVPAFNEEHTIAGTIEGLLALDYPEDRRQILVVSDASTDGTDDIVRRFSDRGVELFRAPRRVGKTDAENAARHMLTGDTVVNTDASVRIHPAAVKALVRCLTDSSVGVASGRDVSTAAEVDSANVGESGYVGYEMAVRALETQTRGIVQASGCLYAVRKEFHDREVPGSLTRDYGAVAFAREAGLRSVSVDDAICYVPRQRSLKREYRRKTRTMTRGLKTVWYRRHSMNPFRFGFYSLMVVSHKLFRWLVPAAVLLGFGVSLLLMWRYPALQPLIAFGAVLGLLGVAGWLWPESTPPPRFLSVPAFILIANAAALNGWVNLLSRRSSAAWAPTRR